jgi:hypothetical protein
VKKRFWTAAVMSPSAVRIRIVLILSAKQVSGALILRSKAQFDRRFSAGDREPVHNNTIYRSPKEKLGLLWGLGGRVGHDGSAPFGIFNSQIRLFHLAQSLDVRRALHQFE